MSGSLPRNSVLIGDAAEQLGQLPDASVDCVITSPPYYALRNYEASGQIGLEPSVHDWVSRLTAVCDEIARVLKPAGSLWLNLGDTYSRNHRFGAPPKGFLLAPERLLLKLVEHGWILRNKVVWAKPNPMPAAVYDRLVCGWEPMYLLVRQRSYYFDLDAVRVPHRTRERRHARSVRGPEPRRPGNKPAPMWAGPMAGDQSGLHKLKALGVPGHPLGKNPGDVWTIPKNGNRNGHHAAFPEALIERPLRASCPECTCFRCGTAWRRHRTPQDRTGVLRSDCDCDTSSQPGVVLDPFLGSGTTAAVAKRLGRDWVGVEINDRFVKLAKQRILHATQDSHGGGDGDLAGQDGW